MSLHPTHIPVSTYRIQFSAHLSLQDARRLVPYLDALGITDAYPSPLFRAREGSAHGYDVVDHGAIDPQLGTLDEFRLFAEELRRHAMGLLIDVVPNHMGIDDPNNRWWQDVLENGPSSAYAKYFDIDWHPPKELLHGKVLLPFLGDQYGKVLENQELRLAFEEGNFRLAHHESRYPLCPRSWPTVLRQALQLLGENLDESHPERMELESIVTALENLPGHTETEPERIRVRTREREVVRRRLLALERSSEPIRRAIAQTIEQFNGQKGDPRSFDRLEALLAEQAYRLAHWRVATDEINYRRFFDINALAAIRVEDPDVFEAVHALIFQFLENHWVTGLRIDHPDGLYDPEGYFVNLQARYRALVAAQASPSGDETGPPPEQERSLYLVAEKILARDENLPPGWPVCGTTGYDFMNLLNGLFVDRRGAYALLGAYVRLTDRPSSFADILHESKRVILNASMASELNVLAGQLDRISEQHRWSRDFTRTALRRALREVIACFPVYRTYIRPGTEEVSDEDRRRILAAIRLAKRRNPDLSGSFFDFIGSVLLLEHPDHLSPEDRDERRRWVMKFQQVTGPVMAKGLEDTSFYRYYPLASLNEVGGEPVSPGVTIEQFHRVCHQRAEQWPDSLSATSTHDTKRGEDVRARLNVLSEMPEAWENAVRRWRRLNEPLRGELDGEPVPDANEEYLVYQTLVGTWPLAPGETALPPDYVQRIRDYIDKALKEAKLHTSWASPNEDYDRIAARFVEAVLDPARAAGFLEDLGSFVGSVADAGFTNGLAQTLLKILAPGVPDFYQGTEFWDFNLVDPDNRRPVDFTLRRQVIEELQRRWAEDPPALVTDLLARWPDPRIKMFLIHAALSFRRQHAELFARGRWVPLAVQGPQSEHVVAAAREHEGIWAVCAVPRLPSKARESEPALAGAGQVVEGGKRTGEAERWRVDRPPVGPPAAAWFADTVVQLPPDAPEHWRHVLTGESWPLAAPDPHALSVAELFQRFPVALLSE